MRFLTNFLSAIAGVFRRTPAPPDATQTDASSSVTMELSEEDIELLYD